MSQGERTGAGLYSRREELACSITHAIGAGLSVAGLALLVLLAALRGEYQRVAGYAVFGASLISLYLASTLYHSSRRPRAKRVFRAIDHAAVYMLIAGTYTPFLLLSMQGAWRWASLATVWTLAFLGGGLEVFFIDRFRKLSTAAYVGMGWLGALLCPQLLRQMPAGGAVWLAAGGLAYTAGVVFYVWRRLPFNHAIWHLFVLGGSACHYVAVLRYQLPVG